MMIFYLAMHREFTIMFQTINKTLNNLNNPHAPDKTIWKFVKKFPKIVRTEA